MDRSCYPRAYSLHRNVDTRLRTTMSEGMWYLKRYENNYFSKHLFNIIASLCVFHSERLHTSQIRSGPECSPRRKQWYLFDHELVLPEYIIYFEYITKVINLFVLLLYMPFMLQVNMPHAGCPEEPINFNFTYITYHNSKKKKRKSAVMLSSHAIKTQ